jgi:hypothetical protein
MDAQLAETPFYVMLTAAGLATATGHRAFIPALLLGAVHHLSIAFPGDSGPFFALGADWAWLASPIVMLILGALVVLEFLAESNPDVPELAEWALKAPKLVAGFVVVAALVGTVNDSAVLMVGSGVLGAGTAFGVDTVRAQVKHALDGSLGNATDGMSTKTLAVAESGWSLGVSTVAIVVPLAVLAVGAVSFFVWKGRKLIGREKRVPCPACGAPRLPEARACPHCQAAIA